jgi:hypothetical protein
VTALLLTCSYKGKEFVRVGYYVNVEYTDAELLDPERPPPNPPIIDKLQVCMHEIACAACADVYLCCACVVAYAAAGVTFEQEQV